MISKEMYPGVQYKNKTVYFCTDNTLPVSYFSTCISQNEYTVHQVYGI